MNAMVFAAGKGTRLKPLTDSMPKALVKVGGKTLLAHVLDKLRAAGFDNIVVNVHHFAKQIVSFLEGSGVMVSDETEQLLETGGGLRKALPLFPSGEPILIHNVDILSNVNLREFYDASIRNDVTLLVSPRKARRYLLFDDQMRLVGWKNVDTNELRGCKGTKMYAFSGIHCVSPGIGKLMRQWPDRFPIMDFYIRHCRELNIRAIVKDDLQVMDVGKLDTLRQAEDFLRKIEEKA